MLTFGSMYPQGNPYAAPNPYYRQNVFVPPGATINALPNPMLKTAKLVCGIGQTLTILGGMAFIFIGAGVGGDDGNALAVVGLLVISVAYLFIFAYAILNMLWLYKMWGWFPPEQRHTNLWKKYISPGTALGFMFIPYFNIYWMFVIYLGMGDIFERMMVQYRTSKPSPKQLAIITLVVSLVFFPAAPFMYFFFAKHVEAMAAEMASQMGRPIG
jgi:hypothetical protein